MIRVWQAFLFSGFPRTSASGVPTYDAGSIDVVKHSVICVKPKIVSDGQSWLTDGKGALHHILPVFQLRPPHLSVLTTQKNTAELAEVAEEKPGRNW